MVCSRRAHAHATCLLTRTGQRPSSALQALLFDEDYESHAFYQYRKARRWLAAAKAIVFVGTSFAVGVTEHALQVADDGSLPVFSINLVDEDPNQVASADDDAAALPRPVIHHITAGCEVTLPKLATLVDAPVATDYTGWYGTSAACIHERCTHTIMDACHPLHRLVRDERLARWHTGSLAVLTERVFTQQSSPCHGAVHTHIGVSSPFTRPVPYRILPSPCTQPALACIAHPLRSPRVHSSYPRRYEGAVSEAVVADVLLGLGVDWTERTTGDGRKLRRRGKKRNRAAPASKHETMWVGCDVCGKWRKLPPGVKLPEEKANAKWQCNQNQWDAERNTCDAPEEPWM